MPPKRVRDVERQRCARACGNCKRRKERCNGVQPCRRCIERGVQRDCKITPPLYSRDTVPRPAAAAFPRGSSTGPIEDVRRNVRVRDDGFRNTTIRSHSFSSSSSRLLHERGLVYHPINAFSDSGSVAGSSLTSSSSASASEAVRDARGRHIVVGVAAANNMGLLQKICNIARAGLGPCSLVDALDSPQANNLVENSRAGLSLVQTAMNPPPKPSPESARYLLEWYRLSTNCIFDIFERAELDEGLALWLECPPEEHDTRNAAYYLILAIGAQSCTDNKDELAETYFNYGRCVTLALTEDPSISTIQCHLLITMYLLSRTRTNSAFMHLGLVVRAAYALGIHSREISSLYPTSEYKTRERLWKAIRVLDLFLSITLGRPASTSETRDTTSQENYSASNDLCLIFEKILTWIYGQSMICPTSCKRISDLHRGWASRFVNGLETDSISPGDHIETRVGKMPNIGLIHLKEAYYWTIMLLTQPFLVKLVSSHTSQTTTSQTGKPGSNSSSSALEGDLYPSPPQPSVVFAEACVDSAIRTVELLQIFLTKGNIPRRLPFVINSVFVSALTLSLALFGDLDRYFPVGRSLEKAKEILRCFSHHDTTTEKLLLIVDRLQNACNTYIEARDFRQMEGRLYIMRDLFGSSVFDSFNRLGSFGGNQSDIQGLLTTAYQLSTHPRGMSIDLAFATGKTTDANGHLSSLGRTSTRRNSRRHSQ